MPAGVRWGKQSLEEMLTGVLGRKALSYLLCLNEISICPIPFVITRQGLWPLCCFFSTPKPNVCLATVSNSWVGSSTSQRFSQYSQALRPKLYNKNVWLCLLVYHQLSSGQQQSSVCFINISSLICQLQPQFCCASEGMKVLIGQIQLQIWYASR